MQTNPSFLNTLAQFESYRYYRICRKAASENFHTWSAAICISALHGSSARIAVMNTCWPIRANAATFAPVATKGGWWSSVSGSAPRRSNWFPTANGSIACPKDCGTIGHGDAQGYSDIQRQMVLDSVHGAKCVQCQRQSLT
jgi:hypothetical protein